MKQLGLGIIVAIGLTLPAFGQGVDPLLGTWKLNLEKTTWTGSPAPKSMIMKHLADGQIILDFVGARGDTGTIKYTMEFSGQPTPSVGSPTYNATAHTRVGNTINEVYFKNGKPVSLAQSRMDASKTFFMHTSEGVDANGQPQGRVLVWERQ
jgi:hypothetical protein